MNGLTNGLLKLRKVLTVAAMSGAISVGAAMADSSEASACGDSCDCAEKKTADAGLVPQPGAQVGDKTLCPVMGEAFEITADSPSVEYDGKKVFFCCPGCAGGFEEDPEGKLAVINAKIDEANAAE